LGNRPFRALWLANVASGIGSTLHDTAAVWTMTTLTSSATLVTLMQAMSSLPLFLLALPAGALADLADRRRVILAAQAASLAVTAALVALSWYGGLTPGILLGVTFLLGVGVAFTTPTWQALLAEMVGKKELTGALTLGSIGVNIARALGPMIAGVLLASTGPTAAFALNAVSFVGILYVLWKTRTPPMVRGAHAERMWGAMITALRFTRHSPVIKAVLLRNAAFAFFGIAPAALLPLIVRARGLAAADFGALMGVYGAGGILAAFFLLPKLRARFSPDAILGGGTLLMAGLVAVLSLLEHRVAMGAVLLLAGAAWLTCMSTLAVAAQSAFPNWVRARSSAVHLIAVQASLACGAVVWGQVTGQSGTGLALAWAAGGLAGVFLLGRVFPVSAALALDLSPSAHWREHHLDLDPADSEGPVAVSLEYEVRMEDVTKFQKAMAALRTVRLRDGAYRWALMQDMAKPGSFQEVFHVGSWGEHLRQHERATEEDRRVEEAVLAWHIGPQPPEPRHHLLKNVPSSAPAGASQ
jgi:Na+/melibiose symporter-like transporter